MACQGSIETQPPVPNSRLQRAVATTTRPDRIGRFVLRRLLGSGTMGRVYVAHDERLGRKVALKLLAPDDTDVGRGQRLLREAQALARVSHPNVVQVYAVGTHQGRPFLAMEYIEGRTLRAWVDTRPRGVAEIVRAYLHAGRGLAAAHDAGLVHRDFKPENVIVGKNGRVCVVDFGLAKAEQGALAKVTRQGEFLGTPAYMAPECYASNPADVRSDQFSFCAALFESLYGVSPFRGETSLEISASVMTGNHRTAPAASKRMRELHAVLQRGLARDPAQRFDSMDQLLRALRRAHRTNRRSRPVRWMAAAAGAVAVFFGSWWAASSTANASASTTASASADATMAVNPSP